MGFSKCLIMVLFSWVFLISKTQQLQTFETQVLMQLRRHLEYPIPLQILENYYGDLCNASKTPDMSLSCEGNSVSELKIKGDKLVKVGDFHGYAVSSQTLSQAFSIDSFVTTLARLNNLRVLSLVSLGIWGPLPDKIHRLSSLELLDLSSNFMFGSVPPELSRLVKLQSLTLDGNFFNGTVPDWFDSLSNLTVLSIRNNSLKGPFPRSICRVKTLNTIALSHNEISGELPDLSELTGLHMLDLRENRLDSELPFLPTGLTTVLLSNNSIHGKIPQQFSALNQLQHLDLSFNHLTGSSPPLALFSLPNISYLKLASNMISGSFPEELSCGDELGFVDMSNNRLMGGLPSCLGTNSDKRVVKFGGNCLSTFQQPQHPESYCESFMYRKQSKTKAKWVLFGVIGGIVVIVVLLSLAGIIISHKRILLKHTTLSNTLVDDDIKPSGISSQLLTHARIVSQSAKLGRQGSHQLYRVFTLEELEDATNGFDESAVLGDGSIGKLYKGRLENGAYIAIRYMRLFRKFTVKNLKLRLNMLSKFRHPHLVTLLGHCIDEVDGSTNRLFLVYEYLPNYSLRAHLSESNPEKGLKWSDRLAVLIGIAKAVHFLHTGILPASYCNRLKTTNILLNEHRIAKLSDYGTSIISGEIPKLEGNGDGSKSGKPKTKVEADDVYNFGFVLLECLVGPAAVSGKEETFLLTELATSFGSGDGKRRIVDPIVLMTSSEESLSRVISITNKCISPESSNRPPFEDILWHLQYAAQLHADSDIRSSDAASSKSY